jgi:hypothetical protein
MIHIYQHLPTRSIQLLFNNPISTWLNRVTHVIFLDAKSFLSTVQQLPVCAVCVHHAAMLPYFCDFDACSKSPLKALLFYGDSHTGMTIGEFIATKFGFDQSRCSISIGPYFISFDDLASDVLATCNRTFDTIIIKLRLLQDDTSSLCFTSSLF